MIQVKVFDEEDEDDLSDAINTFLEEKEDIQLLDVKFATTTYEDEEDVVFSFSALLIYST